MSVRNIGSGNKKSYRERRRGGRDRTAALSNENKKTKGSLHSEDGKINKNGIGDERQNTNSITDNKAAKDHNLKLEKRGDLQQEQGTELATKNRLKEKPGYGLDADDLPTYGSYIKDQKKYRKHAAKVKEYTQPYKSSLEEPNNNSEEVKPDYAKAEKIEIETDTDEIYGTSAYAGTLYASDSPINPDEKRSNKTQSDKLSEKPVAKLSEKPFNPVRSESVPSLKNTSQSPKLQSEPDRKLLDEGSRWAKIKDDGKEGYSHLSEVKEDGKTNDGLRL